LEKPLEFEVDGQKKITAHRLLARTVLYKVAHHGSHNARPRTYGLNLMTDPGLRAFVPVDHAIAAQAKYGEMPLIAITDDLTAKTGGAVVRSDATADDTVPAAFRMSKRQIDVGVKKDGPTVKRPLYCKTTVPFDRFNLPRQLE
jgi:hypothetical protein